MGVAGVGYIEISSECVPCSKQIPERANKYTPMRGVASIIRANGQSLISSKNPQTGPVGKGKKTEKFHSTFPPVFLPSTSFSFQPRNALGLGKAWKRPCLLPSQRCPSNTPSADTGNEENMELGVQLMMSVRSYLTWLWDPLRLQMEGNV